MKNILFIVCIFILAVLYVSQLHTLTKYPPMNPRKNRQKVHFSDEVEQRLFDKKTGITTDSVIIINDKK